MSAVGEYIAFAPLQGYTDAPFRRAHHECAGGVGEYYTPFVRVEKDAVRRRDLRDVDPAANAGVPTVPQVIARDGDEMARLCDALQGLGWRRLDLNLGCPFPMQVRSGRGSGLLQHLDALEEIGREMERRPEVLFSVKMRLGQECVEEGLAALPIVNAMPLCHVALHPRLGRQQYRGLPDCEAFARFGERCTHPLVYNGDVLDIEEARRQLAALQVANLKGIMIGRSLLARPWMLGGGEPREVLRAMHAQVYRHATTRLCGDSQVLARMRAFWEYVPLDRRLHKSIMKATSLRAYDRAVASVWGGVSNLTASGGRF